VRDPKLLVICSAAENFHTTHNKDQKADESPVLRPVAPYNSMARQSTKSRTAVSVKRENLDCTWEIIHGIIDSTLSVLDSPLGSTLSVLDGPLGSVLSVLNSTLDSTLGVLDGPLDSVLGVLNSSLGSVLGVLNSSLGSVLSVLNSSLSALQKTGWRTQVNRRAISQLSRTSWNRLQGAGKVNMACMHESVRECMHRPSPASHLKRHPRPGPGRRQACPCPPQSCSTGCLGILESHPSLARHPSSSPSYSPFLRPCQLLRLPDYWMSRTRCSCARLSPAQGPQSSPRTTSRQRPCEN
jgi:hypothetical protein